jgi:hypothetical protein
MGVSQTPETNDNRFLTCYTQQPQIQVNFKKEILWRFSKKQVIDSINAMPEEEFTDIDVLLERIMMFKKIERAENNIADGKVYTAEKAQQRLSKWLK